MVKQLSFLPEIDRKETQKRVEEALESARIYEQIGLVRREMKMTPLYEARFHGPTNKTGAPTEDTAVWNVNEEERLKYLTEQVWRSVARLGKLEREIIKKRYLEDEEIYDYNVMSELHILERKYYRVKARAFYKLAFMLKMEVLLEKDQNQNQNPAPKE